MSAPLNFQTLFELDINPGGTANYVRIGNGLTAAAVSNNEAVDEKAYLDGNGGKSSAVNGFQYKVVFSGDRIPGDTVQDWILTKLFAIGANRTTNFRSTNAGGTVISGACTIANITPPGGDANSPSAFGFEIHMNGKPAKTDPVAATALTATIAASLATSGCTKCTITSLGAANHAGYKLSTVALAVKNREYVGDYVAYTSGADIAAVAGQYLTVYELDAYEHVVKALCQVLASGDIKA
jgi:hypothetical protein